MLKQHTLLTAIRTINATDNTDKICCMQLQLQHQLSSRGNRSDGQKYVLHDSKNNCLNLGNAHQLRTYLAFLTFVIRLKESFEDEKRVWRTQL